MIKATELRISNLVFDVRGDVQEIEVLSRTLCGFVSGNECGYELIRPIPLTEEWLVKFGFEKKVIQTQDGPTEICVKYKEHYFELTFQVANNGGTWYYDWSTVLPIHHVHQLQNLYYALTGTELELK